MEAVPERIARRSSEEVGVSAVMLVATARDAADVLAPLFADAEREKLVILHLDAERRLISIDEHAVQSEETILLPMREILARALQLGAQGFVVAHNHPSGNAQPSRADIEATRRLAEAAAGLDISLHDHLVFAAGGCRSFRELGLL